MQTRYIIHLNTSFIFSIFVFIYIYIFIYSFIYLFIGVCLYLFISLFICLLLAHSNDPGFKPDHSFHNRRCDMCRDGQSSSQSSLFYNPVHGRNFYHTADIPRHPVNMRFNFDFTLISCLKFKV